MEKRRRAKRNPQLPRFELLREAAAWPPRSHPICQGLVTGSYQTLKAVGKGACSELLRTLPDLLLGKKRQTGTGEQPVFLPLCPWKWLCQIHGGQGEPEAELGGTCFGPPGALR